MSCLAAVSLVRSLFSFNLCPRATVHPRASHWLLCRLPFHGHARPLAVNCAQRRSRWREDGAISAPRSAVGVSSDFARGFCLAGRRIVQVCSCIPTTVRGFQCVSGGLP